MMRVMGSAGTYRIATQIGSGSDGAVHRAHLFNAYGYQSADAVLKYFPAAFHDSAKDEAVRVHEVAHTGVVKLIEIIAPPHK